MNAYSIWQNYLLNFPQTIRYTFGGKIDNTFIEIIESVFIAAHQSQSRERERESKLNFLQTASNKLDLLKFFLQIAWQIKALDNKKYIAISEKIYEIGRMLGGWERSLH